MSTALEELLRARGATYADWHGCALPAHFGDPGREWRAAREGCAVFDAGFRTMAAATGEDRVSFLHGMLSNDVKSLAPGHGMHAAQLTQAGKVVSDMRVYAEPDRLLLDIVAWRVAPALAAFERYLVADDVELVTAENEVPLLGLEGPFARATLMEVLGIGVLVDEAFAHQRAAFQGLPLFVAAVSEAGGRGYLLCGPPELAAPLFDACREAGAVPMGMQALNALRVEAGVPWAGVDMDEDVLAIEAGLEPAISFKKGCYLGQEIVERVSARGHVNRHLAGVVLDGIDVPASGAVLRAEGQDVGYVTSAVSSPALGSVIAITMVHKRVLDPGSRVEVDGAGGATVAALPFVGSEAEIDEEEN